MTSTVDSTKTATTKDSTISKAKEKYTDQIPKDYTEEDRKYQGVWFESHSGKYSVVIGGKREYFTDVEAAAEARQAERANRHKVKAAR